MGGWKGPGQRRGREGPEERRRAAERGGGGGGIPALLSPVREPFPPSCLLLPPPRGAAMTVSAPPGAAPLRPRPGGERRPEPEPSRSPPGHPLHLPAARGGLGRKTGRPQRHRPAVLPQLSPASSSPFRARSQSDPEEMRTPCPGQPLPPRPSATFVGPVTDDFGWPFPTSPPAPLVKT